MMGILGTDETEKIVFVLEGFEREVIGALENGYKIVKLKQMPRILTVSRKWVVRPVVSGISVGNINITAGTLGWFAYDDDGNAYIVSNAHVLTDSPTSEKAPRDRRIVQPGSYDGGTARNVIADYVKHVPVYVNSASSCPVARFWTAVYNSVAKAFGRRTRLVPVVEHRNDVDVAIAKLRPDVEANDVILLDNGTFIEPSEILGLLFAGSEVDNIWLFCKFTNIRKYFSNLDFVKPIGKVMVGDKVVKCGRTTGCTEGEVISTSARMRVWYGGPVATFDDIVVVKGLSKGGDSGSLVWR